MRRKKLLSFPYLSIEKLKKVSIISHRLSDADAYCSSYALSDLLNLLKPRLDVEIGAPKGYTIISKKMRETLQGIVVNKPNISKSSMLLIVDTGHASQLDDWIDDIQNSNAKKISIDHHSPSSSMENLVDDQIIFETISSTSEIIFNMYKAKKLKPSKRAAQAMLLGIQCDSQNLRLANVQTLKVVTELVDAGASLDDARLMLSQKRERSESVARLKSAQRLRTFAVGDWLISDTLIRSFHGSAAKSLIELGADVGIAMGKINDEMRVSLRASTHFCNAIGLHLGRDVAEKIASELGGAGGGHPGAASFTCVGDVDIIRKKTLKTIIDYIGSEPRMIK